MKEQFLQYGRELALGEHYDEAQGCTYLANGESAGTCTNSARLFAAKFNGRVVGYQCDENPKASVGVDCFGHDFALIDDRWIVDWWYAEYEGSGVDGSEPWIFDRHDPAQAETILRMYGDQWKVYRDEHGFVPYPEQLQTLNPEKEACRKT
jgi:hypothetical protein